MSSISSRVTALLAASVLLAIAARAQAVNFTNGNGDMLWTTVGNWDDVGSDTPVWPEGAIASGVLSLAGSL